MDLEALLLSQDLLSSPHTPTSLPPSPPPLPLSHFTPPFFDSEEENDAKIPPARNRTSLLLPTTPPPSSPRCPLSRSGKGKGGGKTQAKLEKGKFYLKKGGKKTPTHTKKEKGKGGEGMVPNSWLAHSKAVLFFFVRSSLSFLLFLRAIFSSSSFFFSFCVDIFSSLHLLSFSPPFFLQ